MRKPLTSLTIATLKPALDPYYVGDTKQDGLRVRVAPDGKLTWNVAVRIRGGKVLSTSLGRCDHEGRSGLDLAGARERAAAIVKAARQGRNLILEEREAAEVRSDRVTLSALIENYGNEIENPNRRGGALRTATEIRRRLTRSFSSCLSVAAQDLKKKQISTLLDDVAGEFPREAEKRRQVIDAMFKWGVAKGYIDHNPAAGLPSYGTSPLKDRVLTSEELKAFWLWLDDGAANMSPDIIAVLRLQLLLGARVGEVAGMTSSEVTSQDSRLVWTLPASRSKNKKVHVRPLVGKARGIVEVALDKRSDGALFRALNVDRALRSDDVGLALNKRKRPIAHFTTHDLRRTVVSILDELGVPLETIAAVVGHRRGSADTRTLIRHYSRPNLDSRIAEALAIWDAHLTTLFKS